MGRGLGCEYRSDTRLQLAPGMEKGYVVKDAKKWEVNTERDASDLDAEYYERLLGEAWGEVAFVFPQ
ncbi:MAG: hypothetical protein WCP70_14355 [Methanothrix sp.]